LDYSKYLLDSDSFILSESSSTSFSVNLDLETILWKWAILSNLDLISLLANIDHSILGACFIEDSSSSGILILISSIDERSNADYLKLSNRDFHFEKIFSINKYSEQQVYDLAIEGTHNFIANGIVAHNTYLGSGIGNELNMNSNKIISLANGTASQDAVTLSQLQNVNTSATASETDPLWTGNFSARTGTGNVVFSTSPTLVTPNIGAAFTLKIEDVSKGVGSFRWGLGAEEYHNVSFYPSYQVPPNYISGIPQNVCGQGGDVIIDLRNK